jgi:hypothetical protein
MDRNIKTRIISLSAALLLIIPAFASADPLVVGGFSTLSAGDPLPEGWEPMTFDDIESHTRYTVVEDEGAGAIRADSRASAAGLIRKISIDPAAYPVIQWRWKAANVLEAGDVRKKSGDDYPARIYITFAYDSDRVGFFKKAKYEAVRLAYGEYPPLGAISYIWASHAPVGTSVPNPYTEEVRMIVIRSGPKHLGTWVTERRNVFEDYRRAFGEDPPKISGVAIMTDTDNTGESATAYYGDIVFIE